MIIRASILLVLIAWGNLVFSQVASIQGFGCHGLRLGPTPPPPPPGEEANSKEYPDNRDAHAWCRKNWCEILTTLIPAPEVIDSSSSDWSRLVVVRTEAFFGSTFQISFREYKDGRVEINRWSLPAWSEVEGRLYECHTAHPNLSPVEVAKSVPVTHSSLVETKNTSRATKRLLRALAKGHPFSIPAHDDGSFWVLTLLPTGEAHTHTFFASQDEALSQKLCRILKSTVPTRLTSRSTRTPPAVPFALSHLPASSAPSSASVQAGPVTFLR
jgi:hypothetical protein